MATQKNTKDLTADADTLALSFEYVSYLGQLYAPVDYETGDDTVAAPADRRCWIPLSDQDIQEKARAQFDTAFARGALDEFVFLVDQAAREYNPVKDVQPWLLIKTPQGLKSLHEDGLLYEPDGSFVPNMLSPMLNEDPDDKAKVLGIIVDWLGGLKEEALSLLRHLATTLAPHYSAEKYVIFVGDGRNGKSLMTTMMKTLLGVSNCSSLNRIAISEGSQGLFNLNGKLINFVLDGQASFIKDSANEKSLVVGEPIEIRRFYTGKMEKVQTNALFLESLNQEPKSKDKSSALQVRMIRYKFPNKYASDDMFAAEMKSDPMLGALLSLLLDNYVLQKDKAIMLAQTEASRRLQLDHMMENSLSLQYILHLETTEQAGAEATLNKMWFDDLIPGFRSWRIGFGDINVYDRSALLEMFKGELEIEQKSKKGVAGKSYAVKLPRIMALKQDAIEVLAYVKEEEINATAVVDDGSV